MSDPNNPREETPEEKERRLMREELFGDIDGEGADTPESITAERDALRAQVATLTSTLTRAQADNLTLSKRADEAKGALTRAEAKFEQDKQYAVEKFVKEMLPVIDTFELGLKSIKQADRDADPKFDKVATGIEKTLGQLTQVFNKFGIKEINPLGETFDESKHEALAVMPKADAEPETVIDVAQKGYELGGRLIRPAKVIVTPAL